MFYVCTLKVSAPGRSGYLGVHQLQSGLCEPVSNLTRRVSNKTFWIATSPRIFGLHFHKVMARESLSLFKTFENCRYIADRYSPISDFSFSFFNQKFRFGPRSPRAQFSFRRLSFLRLFLIHLLPNRIAAISALVFGPQMLPIKSSASVLHP